VARWRLPPRLARGDVGPAVLMFLGMAIFAIAVYVAVVRGGGVLLGRTDSPQLALSVLATAVVALGFEPLRRRLRPVAARLSRGGRVTPYDVLTRFAEHVAGAYPTDAVPARMARLLVEATGANYAQVWLCVRGGLVPGATWPPGVARDAAPPDPVDDTAVSRGRHALAVRHADEMLGVLVVQEHDRVPLTPVEERLFTGLAAQAGLVLRSVRLRAELAVRLEESSQRAAELHESRERIVAAQDEERRRLERDIHDGAQQHLVALAVNLRLVRTLLARSSERVSAVLTQVATAADDTIQTLSDLSQGIYPRLLSEAGLKAALEAAVAASSIPVELTVEEMDRPPHDVEAALYFCCLEALQNAAKHSRASRILARIGRVAGGVELVVSDDGAGLSPASGSSGTGLANMRDRAESAGGDLRVTSQPGRGTVVAVRIPSVPVSLHNIQGAGVR